MKDYEGAFMGRGGKRGEQDTSKTYRHLKIEETTFLKKIFRKGVT